MNEIVNRFLLAGDKFLTEMHLRQPIFTYNACEPFTKIKKMQNFIEKGASPCIYQKWARQSWPSKWYGLWISESFIRWTASDKVLHEKTLDKAKNARYDGYQADFSSMVGKYLD